MYDMIPTYVYLRGQRGGHRAERPTAGKLGPKRWGETYIKVVSTTWHLLFIKQMRLSPSTIYEFLLLLLTAVQPFLLCSPFLQPSSRLLLPRPLIIPCCDYLISPVFLHLSMTRF